jgi:2-dehydro-3-deoxyphosphooctonate aldolase (KDO 8-P synthase)
MYVTPFEIKTAPFLIHINEDMTIGQGNPLVFILGPCVIESREHSLYMAEQILEVCSRNNVKFIFKSSFDKANRSSFDSYRGPALEYGLEILNAIKQEFNIPVTTDVHEPDQCALVAEVVDLLQIPAFLCRQTDLLFAAGDTGCPVNIKKGQFMAPDDMKYVIEKITTTCYVNERQVMVTERGATFGYNNLVVDMRSLDIMRQFGYPVCLDATHSTQLPGGGKQSGGQSKYVPILARAGVAVGVDALFMEVHNNPTEALSDGTNQLPLSKLESVIQQVIRIQNALKE